MTSAWTTPRRIPGGAGFGAPARLTHFSSTPTWYPCLQFLWLILRQHRQCQGDEREHPHCYQQRIFSASSYGKPDQWCLNCKAITIYLTKPNHGGRRPQGGTTGSAMSKRSLALRITILSILTLLHQADCLMSQNGCHSSGYQGLIYRSQR